MDPLARLRDAAGSARALALARCAACALTALLATTPIVASGCPVAPSGGSPSDELGRLLDVLEPGLAFPSGVAWASEWNALTSWHRARADDAGQVELDALARAARREFDAAFRLGDRRRAGDVPEVAARRVEAIGLFVYDTGGAPGAVEAPVVGVYWSTPLGDRLRIVGTERPLRGASIDDLRREARPLVSTCAVDVSEWVGVPIELAEELLAASDGTWLLAFGPGSTARQGPWSAWIETPEIEPALRFEHPAVADVGTYSALFVGPGPGLTRSLRSLPRVSSTLGPLDLAGWLRRVVR